MKKIVVMWIMVMCLLFSGNLFADEITVNIPARVTVREVFRLTVTPTEIDFGTVDMGGTSTVNMQTEGETNCGEQVFLQIKGNDFIKQPNVIKVTSVIMRNTLVSGGGTVTPELTLAEQYQEFAKSIGNPNKYVALVIGSQYTITVPEVVAGTYESIFTVTMTE